MQEPSFGDLLREARERRGLSLEAVSRTTRVPEATLRALEAGGLEGLPPEVYTKGFIRSISRVIGVPEAEPLERYQQALAQRRQNEAAASIEVDESSKPQRRQRLQIALVAGAVLVLLALLVLVLRQA